jgi:glycosyltransferase involved in cell wall biosynthesis
VRIVHLVWGLKTGGTETMLVDIANEQALSDHIFIVLVNADWDKSILSGLSTRVSLKSIKRPPGSKNPWFWLQLYRVLVAIHPDIIHAHQESFIKIIRFLPNLKVATVHATDLTLPAAAEKYRAIFCISSAVRNDLKQRYPGLKTKIVLNGIRLSGIEKKQHFGASPFRIIQVSRLDHRKKGQDILLRAIKHVLMTTKVGHVMVDFVGDDAGSRSYLEALALESGITEQCRFLGNQPRSFIYNTLHGYDLLVQPSRFEGFGLTIVEAMAAKVPVLVSNIEGPMEIIEKGRYGYFFENESFQDCGNKIIEIMHQSQSEGFAKQMEINRNHVSKNYDVRTTAKNYLIEYANLLEKE